MNIQTNTKAIFEFLALCVVITFGFLGWAGVSVGAGWLASVFGAEAKMFAMYGWLSLYILIVVSVFRRWREARRLEGLSGEQRRKYLETAWSLPLGLTSALAIVAALFFWGWQILFWLKTDQWVSLDFVSLLTPLDGEPLGPRTLFVEGSGPSGRDWLVAPRDWYGLHKVAHFVFAMINPSIVLFAAGIGMCNTSGEYLKIREAMLRESRKVMSELEASQVDRAK